jgi:outer membrane protein TolC
MKPTTTTIATSLVILTSFISGVEARGHTEAFDSPLKLTLLEAVESALLTHPSIEAARAGEEESMALVGRSGAERYPQLGGNVSLVQYDKPMLVAPLFGFDLTEPPQFDKTLIRGKLSLGYTLFDGGARAARIESAEARAAGSTAGRVETEMMLIAKVTRAFLGVLTASGLRDAQDRRIESLLAEKRRVEQFLAEGRAARVELLRVEAALAQAEAERIATSVQVDLTERELARLMDAPKDQIRAGRLLPVRLVEGTLFKDWETLAAQAERSSPGLERARQNVGAAEADQKAASSTWVPQVGVLGEFQGYGSSAGDWIGLWHAGVELTYPIYTGGARSSAIDEAGARARKAREGLRMKELEIEEDVDRAFTLALEIHAFVSAVQKAVQLQTEVVRIEKLSLDAGAGTQTDYLRAEADLLRARSSLVEAQNAEITAWVEVARTSGELTREWLETHLEAVP